MIINHNITALNTHRQLNSATTAQSKSMEKLASGMRINKAGDDAAGLAISEKMRGQIRGLDQAAANAQDGISLIATAEGALNETHDILQRMRELATQSANDTNTTGDRDEIQKEMNQLTSEINRIGNTTEFNTKKLLNGEVNQTAATTASVKGASVGNTIEIVSSATKGAITGDTAAFAGVVEFSQGKGPSVTGNKATTFDLTAGKGANITEANNELTLSLNGTTATISLAVADYTDAGATGQEMLDDINGKISTAFGGPGIITASISNDGKLVFEAANKNDSLSLDGGNLLSVMTTNGIPSETTPVPAQDANNSLTITVDGQQRTVALTAVLAGVGTNQTVNGNYDLSDADDQDDFVTALQLDLDAAFGAGKVNASIDNATGKLALESQATGSKSQVTIDGGAGNSLTKLGVDTTAATNGLDVNNKLDIIVDGESKSITIANGSWNPATLANSLQTQINAATDTAEDVSVSFENGKLSITSGVEGSKGSIEITENAFSKAAGLSTGATKTAGADVENAALKFQIGANAGQSMAVDISDMRADTLGVSSSTVSNTKTVLDGQGNELTAHYKATAEITNGTNDEKTEYALDVSTSDKATAAIAVLDESIAKVSAERSKLGSFQNRLEHTINNLGTSSENLTAAESRIRDVDMAKEMMEQTKNSILSQASQAMLAQAQQVPQGVLQLLR